MPPIEEADLLDVLSRITDSVVALDNDCKITYANQSYADNFGFKISEIIGKNIFSLLPKIIGTKLQQETLEAISKKEVRHLEFESIYSKGCWETTIYPSDNGVTTISRNLTERKKAEETLSKAKSQYELVFNSVTEGFANYKIVFDEKDNFDLLVLDINLAGAAQSGVKREEQIGKTWRQVWKGIPEEVFNIYRRVFETGKSTSFEHFSPITQAWYIVTVSKSGKDQFAVTFFNITERKKAEEALNQSKEMEFVRRKELEALMETVPATIWITHDPECLNMTGNKATYDLVGLPKRANVSETAPEEQRPTNFLAYDNQGKPIPLKDLPMQVAARTGKPVRNSEFEFRFEDGRSVWVHGNVMPLLDAKGKPQGAIGAYIDITERKNAEEALKERETLYKTLFDNSQDGFQLLELLYREDGKAIDFRYLKINNAYERIVGVKAADIEGKTAREVFPNYEQNWLEVPQRVNETGKTESVELFTRTVNKYFDLYYFPYSRNKVGTLFRDITERKNLEKQLQDKDRLAAIGATAGMVGHDIRNPLQAIVGDLYLAKEEIKDIPNVEDRRAMLETVGEIEKNVDYINKIVADLQDFARPLNPNIEEADLKSVIDDLLSKNGLPENVRVSVNVEIEANKLAADASFINRIMNNLVSNAVQAMPKGGALGIHAFKEANDVVIRVKDTGVGIPDSVKAKLFTPMFTTKARGQGFGLVVIKRMTEALGGTVSFESEEGKGTTFEVRFPEQKVKS